jgi:hypothetical protein
LVDNEIFIDMKAYVYKIVSKKSEFYYGVRWCYTGDPKEDLWKKYFTSSTLIHELINQNGLDYFKPEIIKIFCDNKEALDFEYQLIKESIEDELCLNRALGKCTIWDEDLKNRVSDSLKKLWENEDYKNNQIKKHSEENNHNYKLPSWRNINSDINSWLKVPIIYKDFLEEEWDFNKYGYGRFYLVKRYGIKNGTARCLVNKFKNGWNPKEDKDFNIFLDEHINARMAE